MLLVYMSLTGSVQKFVDKVGMRSIELTSSSLLVDVDEDYIVVIPTYVGHINYDIETFINHNNNSQHLIGFAGSGNLNFNDTYCENARELSEEYDKPLILTFEYSGTDSDVEKFKEEVLKLEVS